MSLQTEPQWIFIFAAACINSAKHSFVDNQVTDHSLSQLDKATLIELGVTTIGHCLNILNAVKEWISES